MRSTAPAQATLVDTVAHGFTAVDPPRAAELVSDALLPGLGAA